MHVSDKDAARLSLARVRTMIETERMATIKRIERMREGSSTDLDERMEWGDFEKRTLPLQREAEVIATLLAQKLSYEGPAPVILPAP